MIISDFIFACLYGAVGLPILCIAVSINIYCNFFNFKFIPTTTVSNKLIDT